MPHSVNQTPLACEAAVAKWLIGEVVPTLEAIKADPSRLLSAEEAWNRLREHMTSKLAG
jgi:hypothetical protein